MSDEELIEQVSIRMHAAMQDDVEAGSSKVFTWGSTSEWNRNLYRMQAKIALEVIRSAGVAAEEPEWEYRSHVVNDLKRHVLSDWTDEETALAIIGWEGRRPREAAWIERRRPAGEPQRVPAKQEGAE